MGVVGIEDKMQDFVEETELETGNLETDNLETGNLETGNLETGNLENGNFVEKNIYEKILDIIYNSTIVTEYKYDIHMDKRIYTFSEPIHIPYKK